MSGWAWLLIGAAAVIVVAAVRGGRPRVAGWSGPKVAAGVGITLAAIALGGLITTVRNAPVPEQRGIGVSVEDVAFRESRADVGLSVAAAVTLDSCGEDVEVKMTIAPTAEFWIDNHRRFEESALVHVSVPDADIGEVTVSASDAQADAAVPVVAPEQTVTSAEEPTPLVVDRVEDEDSDFTHLAVSIPKWGVTFRPLTVAFSADWTDGRSLLGGCYVELPALAGPPTVLTAAAARDRAVALRETPPGPQTFFTVSSDEAALHAFYNKRFEVTRGVMTLSLNSHTVDDAATLPGPDTNFGGAPAWTCRTSVATENDPLVNRQPGDPMSTDILFAPQGKPAYSAERLSELLQQRTCASYVAITPSGAGAIRDLVLISIGALFSLGIELALSGTRRRDPAPRTDERPLSRRRWLRR